MEDFGGKNDEGKPDWSLVDLTFIEPLIEVFAIGAKNHGFEGWKKKFENCDRRFYAAQMRHTKKSQGDPLAWNDEDECYHLAQVAWNALQRLYQALEEEHKIAQHDDHLDAFIYRTIPSSSECTFTHSDHYYDTGRNK